MRHPRNMPIQRITPENISAAVSRARGHFAIEGATVAGPNFQHTFKSENDAVTYLALAMAGCALRLMGRYDAAPSFAPIRPRCCPPRNWQ